MVPAPRNYSYAIGTWGATGALTQDGKWGTWGVGWFMDDADGKKKNKEAKERMNRTRLAAPGVKPPVYDIIGRRLREYYDEVSQQPVPDRFVELLNRLESKTSKKES
ncbi:MAG: hypothetical protein H7X89_00830 [Rhizobiales bacterium]|nr:hypothetical protein [Hyphomicrobiales bacterium]